MQTNDDITRQQAKETVQEFLNHMANKDELPNVSEKTLAQMRRLSAKQRQLLKTSFADLEGDSVKYALRIFVLLFSEHPSYKRIWPQFRQIPDSSLMNAIELRRHASVYINGLKEIIHAMDDEDELSLHLNRIARAHIKWSVQRYHVADMIDPLLDTIRYCTGKLDRETAEAWTTLYDHISVCLDGYCYCFCEPGSLRRFANPDFTYCCCLHKWSFRRFVCPSEDFVYAATRAISKILRSKYFRVDVVHFLEHPWYMSMELDDSLFYQETPVTSVQKALQELGQNLEYPARVVLPYGYREHIGHCGGNFNSRFRIFHRRLLEGFDFDDAGKLINQLLDKGHESDAMAAEVLDQLEPWQVERYRELEARLSLPEGLFAAITPSEAHNTVQDFSRDLAQRASASRHDIGERLFPCFALDYHQRNSEASSSSQE
ncbi:unnamed protein product, partial [Mesorhabditis spiculigera]